MKKLEKHIALLLTLVMTLFLSACSSSLADEEELSGPPDMAEGIVYDPAAHTQDYSFFFGEWAGTGDTEYDTMTVSAADGGMRLELYKDGEAVVTGYAQVTAVNNYAQYYFFNDADGKLYLFSDTSRSGGEKECCIAAFGTFVLKMPAPRTDGAFEDISGTWYLDGKADAASRIEIDANGEWTLYERTDGDGDLTMADYGYLKQDHANQDKYYAHSRQFEGVVYNMETSFEKEAIWWGGESDTYLPLTENMQQGDAELMAQYAGCWFGGETFWLRLREDFTHDTLDESGQIFNEGYVVTENGKLLLQVEGYYGPFFALRPQDDGTLFDELTGTIYERAAEEDVPEVTR